MAYTTAAQVRQYLKISESGDDPIITKRIAAAQARIDSYCRTTFEAAADSTRYFDYSPEYIDGYDLLFKEDLCAITTVMNGDSIVVASDERTTMPRNTTPYYAIRLLSDSSIVWTYSDEWMDAISIAGRWAYSTYAPDDIVQACTRLAAWLYKQRDHQMFENTIVAEGTVIRPTRMPVDVADFLEPYVKP